MITVFRPHGEASALPTETDSAAAAALAGAVWVDLLEPTREEEALIERVLSIEVPTRDELKDIEPSSRLYSEGSTSYMTASLIVKAAKMWRTSGTSFSDSRNRPRIPANCSAMRS